MKHKLSLVAMLLGLSMSTGSSFTLDAVGYEGGIIDQNPLRIFVPGYGELIFEAAPGSELVISSAYENDNGFGGPSFNFDAGEAVKITFDGLEPLDLDFDFVGLSVGESFTIEKDLLTPQSFIVTLRGEGDGAGIYAVSWTVIPEPASAAMGLVGTMVLLLRRRR